MSKASKCDRDFNEANLSRIDLTDANLEGTNFIWADSNGAILQGAKCDRTYFHFASRIRLNTFGNANQFFCVGQRTDYSRSN